MAVTDLLPLVGDAVVVVVLIYVVFLFVEGRIFSAKGIEKVISALGIEISAQIMQGVTSQFKALSERDERILMAIRSIRGNDELRDMMLKLTGIKDATLAQIERDKLQGDCP